MTISAYRTARRHLTAVPAHDADTRAALRVAQTKIENLEIALTTSRTIGIAVGIVVERCRLTAEDAFELLVQISQRDNRKLRDIANDLAFTGSIDTQPVPRPGPASRIDEPTSA